MPRKARVEFPGAVYHLIDRGDRQEPIVRGDADRECFIGTLGQACTRTGWRVHSWVLMTNHYHLLVETPEANLVAGMRWFQTTYTVRFNRRHRLRGHLFQGRYKSVVVDPEERGYFATVSDYIHLNPVRARMVSLDQRLYNYRWSSYRWYVARAGRAAWFEAGRVLGELGLDDSVGGRQEYARRMRMRAAEELSGANGASDAELRRGWCMGGPAFRERMLQLLEKVGEKFSSSKSIDAPVKRSHDAKEAGRLLKEALRQLELEASEFVNLKPSDGRKLAVARLIRTRTSVPNEWLARELGLGHVSNISRHGLNGPGDSDYDVQLAGVLASQNIAN